MNKWTEFNWRDSWIRLCRNLLALLWVKLAFYKYFQQSCNFKVILPGKCEINILLCFQTDRYLAKQLVHSLNFVTKGCVVSKPYKFQGHKLFKLRRTGIWFVLLLKVSETYQLEHHRKLNTKIHILELDKRYQILITKNSLVFTRRGGIQKNGWVNFAKYDN